MELLQGILSGVALLVLGASAVVAAIAAKTKNKKDDEVAATLKRFYNFLSIFSLGNQTPKSVEDTDDTEPGTEPH